MTHPVDTPPARRGLRIALGFLTLAVLVAPMAYVFSGYWAVTGAEKAALTAERRGVRYLAPLVGLVGTLAEAQSAAVAGYPVASGTVRAAVSKVDAVDRTDGAALGTRQRWAKLRADISSVLAEQPTGGAAYHRYSDLTTSASALVAKVADQASLGADPRVEGYRTMLLLPELAVHSGRVADLVNPVTGTARTSDPDAPPVQVRLAVALDRLAAARDTVREELRGGSGDLFAGPVALESLDELSAAVDDLLRMAAPAAEGGDAAPDQVAEVSGRAREAARTFADQLFDSLAERLGDRDAELGDERFAAAAALVTGLLLATVLLWLTLPGSVDRGSRTSPVSPPDHEPVTGPPTDVPPGLVDAQDLFTNEELLHVGRAVRATRGEPGDGVR